MGESLEYFKVKLAKLSILVEIIVYRIRIWISGIEEKFPVVFRLIVPLPYLL